MEVPGASNSVKMPYLSELFLILYISQKREQYKISWVVNPDRLGNNDFLLCSQTILTILNKKRDHSLLYLILILG